MGEEKINITLNNKEISIKKGASLVDLLSVLDKKPEGIAFAIDCKVVKRQDWEATKLEEGALITMIKAVCGG
ncbi:MAG TPA: sulfur carrier protein ThiS [Paludibacteraceae bacterium]|nr:sulfur carrier protein ThiS [Paludibacteraceae bacterium]HPH63328.1 sulfur carrier protein ThiS [Paludibacteraceae bacterium]HQF50807.1 sulfur carrier protein ThiS [Paludibacteraceae bacterium]HQJ89270.1 sulfur carrier protein ThiS [Paludibacteraceae bacterium]